eukprot:gene14475-16618_t
MEQLGASYFQGSYIQGGRQVSGTLADNSALRDACERIERIEKVIDGTYPLATGDICQPCLYDVSRRVDRHMREENRVKKAYDNVLEQSSGEASHNVPKAVPSSTSRAIDQYLQSVDLAHLIAASEDLARDIQQLEDDERRLSEQDTVNWKERGNLLHLLSQQSLEEANLEYHLCRYEQTLPRLHMLLDASGHELNYLLIQKRQNTSKNIPLPISLSPLFDPVQVYRSQYGILNGRRLAYVEQPQCKLMWDEINASWSNLATVLLCIRNSRHLPSGIHLQKTQNLLYQALCADGVSNTNVNNAHNQPSFNVQPVYEYTHILQLRPFIDHTLLQVHCTRTHSINHTDAHNNNNHPHYYAHNTHKRTDNNTNQHSANQKETATREFVLHLEGGVHSAAQEKERSKSRPLSGYDDASSTNREYRTSVLTLACAVVGTILEIHYECKEDANSTGKPPSKHSPARSTFTENNIYNDNMLQCVTVLDSPFDGLLRDLACVLITIGDQLSFAVPQHTIHPRTLYTSTIGHTSRAYLTSNGFTINSIYPATNEKNSPSTETVNVDIVNASTLASSVLANSTLLRTTLFDSVAYFGAYTGIMGPTTAAPTTTVDNSNSRTNNIIQTNHYTNTSTRPGAGEFTPPRQVVSTANSPVKPSERVAYDTINSLSNPSTPHIADPDSPDNHPSSSNNLMEKYQREVQLLQEYKQYCVQTNTKCDIYSALLVCSEVELREVEVMQKLVIDLMNTLSKNFRPSV